MIDAYITLISILLEDDLLQRANAYITVFSDDKPKLYVITTNIDYVNDVMDIQCKTVDVKEHRPFEYDCKEHTILNTSKYTDQIILIPEWIEYKPNKVAYYVQERIPDNNLSHWNSKIITTTVITANRLINLTNE